MRGEWRESKAILFGDYDVRFLTLWVDTRDVMCDSPLPEWQIAEGEKRIIRLMSMYDHRDNLVLRVSKDEGNAIYREMVRIDNHGYGRAAAREWVAERRAQA